MTADKALRRARWQIERGQVTIRGRDPHGKRHTAARTLGRLDWRLEAKAAPASSRTVESVPAPLMRTRRPLAPLALVGRTFSMTA